MWRQAFPTAPGRDRIRRARVRVALVAMLLSPLLCGASLAERQAARPTPPVLAEARNAQPFGAGVPAGAAHSVARALARLAVLEKGATLLEDDLAARMGTADAAAGAARGNAVPDARMRALASAVFPVAVSDVAGGDPQQEAVTARILASPRDAAQAIRRALQTPDNLELRLDALGRLEQAAAEGSDLLARSAALRADPQADQTENPFAGRAETLGKRLDALEAYLDALRDFDHTWRVPQEAVPLLERLSALDPHNALIWMGLGEALLLTERPYEALDALRAATRLPEAPPRALYLRGVAHLRLHLPANAIDDFSEALAHRPDKAAWWRARGAARLLAAEHDAMCPDFYQACALGDCEGLAEVRKRGLCREPGGER